MTKDILRDTARIYQFPIRDRVIKAGPRESQKRVADLASAGFANVEAGSGWYHDAAIQDAEQVHKR
jgi:hypothetical protein